MSERTRCLPGCVFDGIDPFSILPFLLCYIKAMKTTKAEVHVFMQITEDEDHEAYGIITHLKDRDRRWHIDFVEPYIDDSRPQHMEFEHSKDMMRFLKSDFFRITQMLLEIDNIRFPGDTETLTVYHDVEVD